MDFKERVQKMFPTLYILIFMCPAIQLDQSLSLAKGHLKFMADSKLFIGNEYQC